MMDWTDRHGRSFLRILAPGAALYTEMTPAPAIWHGEPGRFLAHDPAEHPLALQLGDSDPQRLGYAAHRAREWGFEHVNLNVGCPSDRVRSGAFGACLMKEPARVADGVAAMAESGLVVSVKCRIGVDGMDSEDAFHDFIDTVRSAGCRIWIVHARKAWLHGLSPKENREVPPLDYGRVFRLQEAFPGDEVILNGGLRAWDAIREALRWCPGVMVGREACENPYALAVWDARLRGVEPVDRAEAVHRFLPYVEAQLQAGERLPNLVKIPLGLFNGCPGAKKWRRRVSEEARRCGAGPEVLEQALHEMPLDQAA